MPANQTIAGNVAGTTAFTSILNGTKIIDITGDVNLGGSSILSFTGGANDYFVVNVGGFVVYDHWDGGAAYSKLSPEEKLLWSDDPAIWQPLR